MSYGAWAYTQSRWIVSQQRIIMCYWLHPVKCCSAVPKVLAAWWGLTDEELMANSQSLLILWNQNCQSGKAYWALARSSTGSLSFLSLGKLDPVKGWEKLNWEHPKLAKWPWSQVHNPGQTSPASPVHSNNVISINLEMRGEITKAAKDPNVLFVKYLGQAGASIYLSTRGGTWHIGRGPGR